MPVTADSTIQSNTGQTVTSGTSVTVSLPSGTAAGNTVVICFVAGTTATPPTGFTTDISVSTVGFIFHKSDVTAGETSWSVPVTGGTSHLYCWYVEENDSIDSVEPLDASAKSGTVPSSISNGGTRSSGTTGSAAAANTVAIAVWGCSTQAGQPADMTWGSYTNGFEEVFDSPTGANPTDYQMAVARKFTDASIGTYETTATLTTTASTGNAFALIAVFRAKDSAIAAPLAGLFGFDWGTHGGITGGVSANSLVGSALAATGTWGTHYDIGSSYARTSGYGFRVITSSATCRVPLGTLAATGKKGGCFGFDVRVVSSTGTVVVAEVVDLTGTVYSQIVYDTSTTKFGARAGSTGTIQYASTTTAANTWVWIGFSTKTTTSTFEVRWRLETATDTYTAQTDATLTGQTSAAFYALALGSGTSQTMTAHYDNVVISPYYAAYPLGKHTVKLLKVDPAGTPSVSGTSGNFGVFTANSTSLAAWNATNARNAVDEVPPDVSATADGVAQQTAAASDYMEFPMETYTCAADEIVAGVRALAPEWGGTGSGTGTLGMRGYDGSAEATIIGTVNSHDAANPTAYSTTDPLWMCGMWLPSGAAWTQAKLDAAAVRIGFSGDATPDMGVHAVYLEVAIKKVASVRTLSVEADTFTADLYVHPYTSSTVSYVITNNDSDRTAQFNYSLAGTPQTPVVVTAASSSTLQLNADAFGDISDIGLTPL